MTNPFRELPTTFYCIFFLFLPALYHLVLNFQYIQMLSRISSLLQDNQVWVMYIWSSYKHLASIALDRQYSGCLTPRLWHVKMLKRIAQLSSIFYPLALSKSLRWTYPYPRKHALSTRYIFPVAIPQPVLFEALENLRVRCAHLLIILENGWSAASGEPRKRTKKHTRSRSAQELRYAMMMLSQRPTSMYLCKVHLRVLERISKLWY